MLHLAAKDVLPKQNPQQTEIPADDIRLPLRSYRPICATGCTAPRLQREVSQCGLRVLAAALLLPVAMPQLNAAADDAISQIFNSNRE